MAAGLTTVGIDAVLDSAGRIKGTVTDTHGTGLADVLVDAYSYVSSGLGAGTWESVGYVFTDASGAYDMPRLAAGTYRVEFYDYRGGLPPEYYENAPSVDVATDIPVTAGMIVSGIDAILGAPTHKITSSAGAHGTISPSRTVDEGTSPAFSITPDAGYQIADVLVDNKSVGAVASYKFNGVGASHTISATFAARTYSITASTGIGGAVSPAGSRS